MRRLFGQSLSQPSQDYRPGVKNAARVAIVMQVAAASKALDRAGFKIISTNLQECLARDGEPGEDGASLAELEKLFLSLA